MGIKLKRFKVVKACAFIVCMVMFLGSLTGIALTSAVNISESYPRQIDDVLLYDSYKDSVAFQRDFDSRTSDILYMLNEYREYMRNGDPASEEAVNHLREFEQYKTKLSGTAGLKYYAGDGTYSVTNIENLSEGNLPDSKLFTDMPAYLVYQNGNLIKTPASSANPNEGIRGYDKVLENKLDSEYNPNLKVCFAFDSTYMAENTAAFDYDKAELIRWISIAVICGILALISLVYLVIFTGKEDGKASSRIHKIDKMFTEIKLLIIATAFVAGGAGFLRFLFEAANYKPYYDGNVYFSGEPLALAVFMAAAIGMASAGIGLAFILSCVRDLKEGRFLGNSLIYKALSAVYGSIRDIYNGGSTMRKVVIISLSICLLSATVFMAPVVFVAVLVVAPKWVKKFEGIKNGVDEVKGGNLAYKIPEDGKGELDILAKGINEISEASNISVQNELKNQRMKTDLISNVSHDLKTPLTSIITYIDLLKREGLDSPGASKYLDILDQKSKRLQNLTEDLFDAAKASSGAIPVNLERVDMLSLINQGLGEMEDKIRASGLEFRVNAKKENYYVLADSQLIWRVVENLLNNVLKYAQEGSRVYIDLKDQTRMDKATNAVVLEMKNISRSELNIDAAELMERFRRGDESRTTEGSGLGLAIAKDLVGLQNGLFEIVIDGDMFKVIVTLDSMQQ